MSEVLLRAIIVNFDPNKKIATLRSDEHGKIDFDMSQWKGRGRPAVGGEVDFDPAHIKEGQVTDVFPVKRSDQTSFYFPEDDGKQRLTYGILSLGLALGGIITGILWIITIPIAVWVSWKGLQINPDQRDGSYVLCQVAFAISLVCAALMALMLFVLIAYLAFSFFQS